MLYPPFRYRVKASRFEASFPDFEATFADAGSGVVTITTTKGSPTGTFTRATTATTVGSTGLVIKGVASGSPRSRYDPTSLAYQGYFAEGARTNICLQSEDLATTWTNTRSTESTNATTAPDGTSTADKLVEDATAAQTHLIAQTIAVADTTVYTASVFLKAGERTWAAVRNRANTGNSAAYFDLTNGVVGTLQGDVTTATIKAYPSGWYRCTVTVTSNTTAGGGIEIYIAEADNDVTFNGDGASGIYVWGVQLEAGSFASSYIPTTTASVTRNADVLTYPFILNAGRGTFYAELSTLWATASGIQVAAATSAQGALLYGPSAGAATVINTLDGTNTVTKTGLTSMLTGVRKRASSWGSLGLMVTGDGAAVGSGSFDGDHGGTGVAIGCANNGTLSLFGTIKNARGWLAQASAAQLQSITT